MNRSGLLWQTSSESVATAMGEKKSGVGLVSFEAGRRFTSLDATQACVTVWCASDLTDFHADSSRAW
ncbi:MAG: hypothetical protein KDA52_22570 [Planctomycetaceae bacterium]|nr:hypothetical protein [Planctomycetaceae bacterium]